MQAVLFTVKAYKCSSKSKMSLYLDLPNSITEAMIVEIDGISIQVTKKRMKNVILRIYPPDGLVKLSVPLNYSHRLIERLLQKKSSWIKQQQDKITLRPTTATNPLVLQTGASIPFQGKNYLMILNKHNGNMQIELKEELLYFSTPNDVSQQQIHAYLNNWYKKQMGSILPTLIQYWESIIPVKSSGLGIRAMKTRWGSCNTRSGRISLNLHLIQKPIQCLEYVLVHELVHLLEASHNSRFYALMDQYMPDWRQYYFMLEGKMPRK